MGKLSELKRLGVEDMEGADKVVVETYLPYQNSFNEDVFNRINGDIGVDNTNNAIKSVKLIHGVEKIIKNPLADKRIRPVGIHCIDTDGLPLAGSVKWRNMANDQVGITVFFDNSEESTGYAGELVDRLSRLQSAAVALTTGTVANVATTASLTLNPGKYIVRGGVSFTPAAGTSITQLIAATSSSSATLPAADATWVPQSNTIRNVVGYAAFVPNAEVGIPLPTYRAIVADGATQTLFLTCRANFTVSTLGAYGFLEAIREVPYRTGLIATCKLFFVGG